LSIRLYVPRVITRFQNATASRQSCVAPARWAPDESGSRRRLVRWGSDKDAFHTEVAQHHLKLSELIMYANNEDVRHASSQHVPWSIPFDRFVSLGSSPSAVILLDLVSSQAVPRFDGRGARVQSGKHGQHCTQLRRHSYMGHQQITFSVSRPRQKWKPRDNCDPTSTLLKLVRRRIEGAVLEINTLEETACTAFQCMCANRPSACRPVRRSP
jgi:hypothetical protein